MQSQWPLTNETKYGNTVITMSNKINSIIGTELTYAGCVFGLFGLWILFRSLTVVSLVLQDKQY